MQPFTYERPTLVEDAVALLAGAQTWALAGGTDLIPQLKEGRHTAKVIVDLKHIPQMRTISRWTDGGWRIGGAVSVTDLAAAPGFAREHAGLVAAAQLIGCLQIQSRATLAGNLCNGAPSADAVPLLMSLDARAVIAGADGQRTVPIDGLLSGPGRTTLVPGEIVTAILLPPRAPCSGARYLRFTPRREMDIAVAGTGVCLMLGPAGEIRNVRITLASVGPVPIRAIKAEARLAGDMPSEGLIAEAARIAAGEARPISDTRASADYRRQLVEVLTRRALEATLAEAHMGAEPS